MQDAWFCEERCDDSWRRKLVCEHAATSAAFLQQPATANQSRVVLNSESCGAPLLEKLWDASDYVCCADGGANRAHDLLGADRAPDAVVGDLDSARADVLAAYEKNGCAVHRVEDQDANDLEGPRARRSTVGRRAASRTRACAPARLGTASTTSSPPSTRSTASGRSGQRRVASCTATARPRSCSAPARTRSAYDLGCGGPALRP